MCWSFRADSLAEHVDDILTALLLLHLGVVKLRHVLGEDAADIIDGQHACGIRVGEFAAFKDKYPCHLDTS